MKGNRQPIERIQMHIGMNVIVKATNVIGKITGQQDGFWVVTFSNGNTKKCATYQLKENK